MPSRRAIRTAPPKPCAVTSWAREIGLSAWADRDRDDPVKVADARPGFVAKFPPPPPRRPQRVKNPPAEAARVRNSEPACGAAPRSRDGGPCGADLSNDVLCVSGCGSRGLAVQSG